MKKKPDNELLKSVMLAIFVTLILLSFPVLVWSITGEFTWDFEAAIQHQMDKERVELEDMCEWGASNDRRFVGCNLAPCKRFNVEGYTCLHEGHTGSGFLGMTDWNTEYYVCEELGRVALYCSERFGSPEEYATYRECEDNLWDQKKKEQPNVTTWSLNYSELGECKK